MTNKKLPRPSSGQGRRRSEQPVPTAIEPAAARIGILAILFVLVLVAGTTARTAAIARQVGATVLVVGASAFLPRVVAPALHMSLLPGRHDFVVSLLFGAWAMAWVLLVLHTSTPVPAAVVPAIAAVGIGCLGLAALARRARPRAHQLRPRRAHRNPGTCQSRHVVIGVGPLLGIFIITITGVVLFGLVYFFALNRVTHGDRNLDDVITVVLVGTLLLGILARKWVQGRR